MTDTQKKNCSEFKLDLIVSTIIGSYYNKRMSPNPLMTYDTLNLNITKAYYSDQNMPHSLSLMIITIITKIMTMKQNKVEQYTFHTFSLFLNYRDT